MHIRTRLKQLNHDARIAVLTGKVKTCPAILIYIRIKALGQLAMDLCKITNRGCIDQEVILVFFFIEFATPLPSSMAILEAESMSVRCSSTSKLSLRIFSALSMYNSTTRYHISQEANGPNIRHERSAM